MQNKEHSAGKEHADGGYGWVVVTSAFFICFITDGLVFSFGILLIELLDHFHKGRAATVTIVSVMAGVMYLVGPLAGALCEKFGCRVVVVIGAVISCVGFLISAYATSVLYLCLSHGALVGLGFGLMYIPAGVCVIQHFNKRRTLANGVAVCGSGVGTFVCNQLTRTLIDNYGWRGALILEAGITLQGAVLGLFLLPPTRMKKSKVDLERCSEELNEKTQRVWSTENTVSVEVKDPIDQRKCETIAAKIKTALGNLFHVDLLRNPFCWLIFMAAFVFQLAFTIPFNLIPDQAKESGMSKQQATWLTSSIGISNTISRICVGLVGDFGCVNRLVMLEVILFITGLSTGVSILLTSFELKLVYTCLYGFLVGGYVTLLPVVLADLFGSDIIAKSFGLLNFFIGVSGFISTPVGGFLFDKTGTYDATFVVAGAEFVLSGLLLLLLNLFLKRHKKEDEHQHHIQGHQTQPIRLISFLQMSA